MKKLLISCLLIAIALSHTGCFYFNERGVSTRYYNDCKEYYDLAGRYHNECEQNLFDYSSLNPFSSDDQKTSVNHCEGIDCYNW